MAQEYRQDQLPPEIFNSGDGDIKTFNGQRVRVKVNSNGTRSLEPLSQDELFREATNRQLEAARQAQQMQLEANKPAIESLTAHKSSLDQKYAELLQSIDASEGVAADKQTLATGNELARRGLSSDSGVYQQEQAKAAAPVAAEFGQLKAQTGTGRERDLTGLAESIASLQAGNVPNALGFASNLGSYELQAQQLANNFLLGKEQNQLGRDRLDYDRTQNTNNPFMAVSEGQGIYDTSTGKLLYTQPKTYKGVQNNLNGWD